MFVEMKDLLFYIGEVLGRLGIYFVLGYGGNGVIFSVLVVEIIWDFCFGVENEKVELFWFGC